MHAAAGRQGTGSRAAKAETWQWRMTTNNSSKNNEPAPAQTETARNGRDMLEIPFDGGYIHSLQRRCRPQPLYSTETRPPCPELAWNPGSRRARTPSLESYTHTGPSNKKPRVDGERRGRDDRPSIAVDPHLPPQHLHQGGPTVTDMLIANRIGPNCFISNKRHWLISSPSSPRP